MSRLAFVLPVAACLVTGAGLYVTRGVLDVILSGEGAVRLALLPSWQALVGFIGLAALLVAAVFLLGARRGANASHFLLLGDLTLPLLGIGILLIPFLPVWPDQWPILQILAGPLRYVVWLVVAAQLSWVVWQAWPITVRGIERKPLGLVAVAVALGTALVSGAAAARLTGTAVFPGGDEPHYLVIAQSLWRDGDLKIANNHKRGDYHEYYEANLDPHYLTLGKDGEIYSVHPVGLPVLLAPIYAAGGYHGVLLALIAMASVATGLAWWWTAGVLGSYGAATFAWAAIAGSAPFLFNTFTVYPEIAAALAVMVAIVCASPRGEPKGSPAPTGGDDPSGLSFQLARWMAIGLACGALPWLSTKYAPMSAVLMLVALARVGKHPARMIHQLKRKPPQAVREENRGQDHPGNLGRQVLHPAVFGANSLRRSRVHELFGPAALVRNPKTAALMLPYAMALTAWFAFFNVYWGSPWPQAPYGAMTQTTPANLLLGGPGLLFDQEYGLLAYAPAYILAATGLVTMWRSGGGLRRQAVEITLIFGALIGTVGAFGIWWGGTAAPARPIASGLLLLALPIAAAFRSAPAGSPRRAAQHLLLWIGVGVAVTLAVSQEGLLVNNDRDGTSALLEWWLPTWDTWTLAPSFIRRDASVALAHTAAWLAAAGAAAAILSRWRIARPGAAMLAASSTLAAALVIVAIVVPWLPGYANALGRLAPHKGAPYGWAAYSGRSRLAALDAYDARALPVAVIYDPARIVRAAATLPLLRMEVEPGLRTDPQPVRVIHNGRFSVPAGRYDIGVTFSDLATSRAEPLSLQVGRTGPPLETWTLQPTPGQDWHTTIDLPVDVSFLGFRGSLEMERAIASITVTPTSVVNAGARPRVPTVYSAARYEGVRMFLHDGEIYPEAGGFWTNGRHTSIVTVSPPPERKAPVLLIVHSGPKANRVTFSTRAWRQTLELAPGVAKEVTLPAAEAGVIVLTIWTEDGFSPSEIDPTSRDPRFLGIWIEVAKQ